MMSTNRQKRRRACAVVALTLACSSIQALSYRPAFLDISAFSRPAGMGGAYTALAEDAAGVFYNPAGPNQNSLRLALTDWYVGSQIASGAGAWRIPGIVNLSVGLSYLAYGTLTRWDEQGNPLGTFSPYSLTTRMAVARTFGPMVTIGLAGGYTGEGIDSSYRGGLGGDLGVRFAQPRYGAAVALRDFSGTANPYLLAGGAYVYPIRQLLLTVEANYLSELKVRAGGELTFEPVCLRAGYDGENLCFGLGLKLKGATLDYAVTNHTKLGLAYQLTLGINR